MAVKIQCSNPDCLASFAETEIERTRVGHCPACGWKLKQFDDQDSGSSGNLASSSYPPTRDPSSSPPPSFGAVLPPTSAFAPGSLFAGRYKIVRELGRGGMGVVLQASDTKLPRDVAIKVPLQLHDEELLRRFLKEAEAAAKLDHPNICRILDLGEWNGTPFIVLAFVKGKTLADAVGRKALEPIQAAKIARSLTRTLQFAHECGIVHRDLKPANLMIGPRRELIVMDFGLARLEDDDERKTRTGQSFGTLHYMAPEQVEGRASDMGKSCDIYTAGVIFYELLTGQLPFTGPRWDIPRRIVQEAAAPPSSLNPSLDEAMDRIVLKAMAKKIGDRYASMKEFAEAIEGWLARAVERISTEIVTAEKPKPQPFETLPLEPVRLREHRPALPPFDRRLILATLAGIVAVILGVVIYIATDAGTLKIEGSEPGMVVRIDGQVTTIETVGKPITVRTGEHGLLIKRGDVVAKAPEVFEIKRGRETVVRIEFTPKILAKAPPPADPVENKPEPPKVAEKPANPNPAPPAEMKKDVVKPSEPASFAGREAGDQKTIQVGNIDVVLCWCPPTITPFKMGSPKTEPDRGIEEDQVDVTITKGFWVMKTEMTQELYEALMGKNPSNFKGPKLPVETVTHAEAVECSAKLTQKLRESNLLPDGWEVRLPTEAQWEYAARAGTNTATSFGDSLSSTQANFKGNVPYGGAAKGPNLAKTAPVGSYKPNAWGLCDTAGNVYELTLGAYEPKMLGGADPFVAGGGASDRVFRGGSWTSSGSFCRSAYRRRSSPEFRLSNLGFRLAAVPTQTKTIEPKPVVAASFAGRKAGELKTIQLGKFEVVLCWCPPTTTPFKMGSPTTERRRDRDDENQVNVTITQGFWMMSTEITQEHYTALMGNNPSEFHGSKLPVERVDYADAKACAALFSQKLHETHLLPDDWEIRLPTEAQWEYAARAGTKTATPFGDSLSSIQANFDGNNPYGGAAKGPYLERTATVGSYKPNAWGLFDTVGNVWEWTLDAYEAMLPGGSDPFVAGVGASDRVVRGGGWGRDGELGRSAIREGDSPTNRFPDLGFRLAADPIQTKKVEPKPSQEASFAGRQAGKLKTIQVDKIELILCWCPAGRFTMGSPTSEKDRQGDEGPVEVTLTKGFWVMKTEMTQELYETLMGENPSEFKGPKLPVEKIGYAEAVECAAQLTQKLRDSNFLPDGWEIRLPTEAQWEYAARAGTKTATPFGASLASTQANFRGNFPYGGAAKGPYLAKTAPVGNHKPNAWGLCDTVGNVWEWTLDAYEAKTPGGTDPFVAGAGTSLRVIRGGSWISRARDCRSAFRSRYGLEDRDGLLGFRLAAVRSREPSPGK